MEHTDYKGEIVMHRYFALNPEKNLPSSSKVTNDENTSNLHFREEKCAFSAVLHTVTVCHTSLTIWQRFQRIKDEKEDEPLKNEACRKISITVLSNEGGNGGQKVHFVYAKQTGKDELMSKHQAQGTNSTRFKVKWRGIFF